MRTEYFSPWQHVKLYKSKQLQQHRQTVCLPDPEISQNQHTVIRPITTVYSFITLTHSLINQPKHFCNIT